MNWKLRILFLVMLVVWLPGCQDRLDLEQSTLALMIGIDLDEHDELVFSISSPVLNTETKEKSRVYQVKARTLRQARREFDELAGGLVVAGKTQILLIGNRLLQHGNWYPLLDVLFRDAKNTLNMKVVAVDGKVSDIMNYSTRDTPRLYLHLTSLIDTAAIRNQVARTTLQQLDRQMYEKGITPYITELKKDKERIKLTGTALLDKKGKPELTLNQQEPALLNILQNNIQGQLSLTLSIPSEHTSDITDKNMLSFNAIRVKTKTKIRYDEGKFQFNLSLDMSITLTERLFFYDMEKNKEKLEQQIQEQLQKQFKYLIKKCQNHQIDPFGLGLFARAYQYEEWKQVQDHWGKAFSKADVKISVKTKIKYMGSVK